MTRETSTRECEKPDDGLVRNFLGFPQRKNHREADELRRSPYLLLPASAYDNLVVKVFVMILKTLHTIASVLVTLMFIGSMLYGLVFTVWTIFGWVRQILGG